MSSRVVAPCVAAHVRAGAPQVVEVDFGAPKGPQGRACQAAFSGCRPSRPPFGPVKSGEDAERSMQTLLASTEALIDLPLSRSIRTAKCTCWPAAQSSASREIPNSPIDRIQVSQNAGRVRYPTSEAWIDFEFLLTISRCDFYSSRHSC
jgi:hypothetical protein